MAAQNDPKELVKKYLADLHSLAEHGHKAIKRQRENLKDSDFPEALTLVADFEQMLDRHTSQLEAQLKSLGGNVSSPVQDTASTVAGFVAGLYNAVRSEEASKSIRDDYTFFSHTAIASLMLHTTCKALGDEQTAMFANNVYRDTAKCIERIDVMMPRLIVHELKKDGLNARDVSNASYELVRSSWGTASDALGSRGQTGTAGTSTTAASQVGATPGTRR
jgi:hypothetical protein